MTSRTNDPSARPEPPARASRIFLTGASGVIGRRVVPLLAAAGHRVTAVGRTPEKRAALERLGADAVNVDLFDAAAVRAALAGHDTVINLATHMPRSSTRMMLPGAWRENDRVRRIGSAALVDAALAVGATRFIQESFAPIYADAGDRWIDESAPVRPARYNRSVLDAEHSAERFTEHGGTGVVLRFAWFYGTGDRFTGEVLDLVRRGWAPLPGAPDAWISAVNTDDAARAVVAALGARAGTYNVVDDEPLTRRGYFDAVARALGVAPPRLLPRWVTPLFGSAGELMSRSQRMSNAKLRAECAWTPCFRSVREGWRAVVGAG